jgi:tRNA nucleotidyltransferase/poly(A) polymerase
VLDHEKIEKRMERELESHKRKLKEKEEHYLAQAKLMLERDLQVKQLEDKESYWRRQVEDMEQIQEQNHQQLEAIKDEMQELMVWCKKHETLLQDYFA